MYPKRQKSCISQHPGHIKSGERLKNFNGEASPCVPKVFLNDIAIKSFGGRV